MILKKLCAALMSVAISINTFVVLPPLNPAIEPDSGLSIWEKSTLDFQQPTLLSAQSDSTGKTRAANSNLRRPVSPEQPMWIIHIDSWNYADPAKIIDLVPKDILPYAVFNISLSINWDSKNKKWLMVQDGYETAKSWLRTCAEKGVWAMIQPASGGQCHFPDYAADADLEDTVFGEFFRDYPNFIGFNYCEQFWGFAPDELKPGQPTPDFLTTCPDRYRHFAALLKLCNKYGGYLDVSWCLNQWSPSINPIAMLKRIPEWEAACRQYAENYILEEKYTQISYIADVESVVYGYYLSGYCGNFGIRYDESGWSDSTYQGSGINEKIPKEQYRLSTGLPIHLERMALNGLTVIDGPELVWTDDFRELSASKDDEGYYSRQWGMYDQFQNDMIDMFRKVLDGSIRIPSRQEAIERTKLTMVQDIPHNPNSGDIDYMYSTYPSLFEGVYRMPGDGNLKDNRNPYKCTGRYPTIPTVYALLDDVAKSIPYQIKHSDISSRWPTIEAKQTELNSLFPEESWGSIYAGRNENSWVTYNPNKDGTPVGGYFIPKYNTCKQVELAYTAYASGLINEYSDHIDFYLNNYDEKDAKTRKTNTIRIYGASEKPTYTCKKRGVNQIRNIVTEKWSNGVYELTVNHNGPVDIRINCAGNETGRLTSYQTASLVSPSFPDAYTGPRQYEAEFFDSKDIERNITNGCTADITKFQGQGYMNFGKKATAAVRDTVTKSADGNANLILRYSCTSDINNVDLYVNDTKISTLSLTKGTSLSDWQTVTKQIPLKKGENKIVLKASAELADDLYLDNFVIEDIS